MDLTVTLALHHEECFDKRGVAGQNKCPSVGSEPKDGQMVEQGLPERNRLHPSSHDCPSALEAGPRFYTRGPLRLALADSTPQSSTTSQESSRQATVC
jgi:hypothetical protein